MISWGSAVNPAPRCWGAECGIGGRARDTRRWRVFFCVGVSASGGLEVVQAPPSNGACGEKGEGQWVWLALPPSPQDERHGYCDECDDLFSLREDSLSEGKKFVFFKQFMHTK